MKSGTDKTMITAFPFWNDRIAPVFDVAGQIHLVESDGGVSCAERQILLHQDLPSERTLHMVRLGVSELVCGAISRPMEVALVAQGIHVIPFVSGELREVIQAWLDGTLHQERFAMPGCCGRWRQGWENRTSGCRQRGTDSPGTAGSGGYCICPQCGRRETHQRGIPCGLLRCPQCGGPMIRER
jgi:predicted Fe-Mo cluster-binding NifX family protein